MCVVEAKTTQAVFGEHTSQYLRVGPLYVTHVAIDKKNIPKNQPYLRHTNNSCLPLTNHCWRTPYGVLNATVLVSTGYRANLVWNLVMRLEGIRNLAYDIRPTFPYLTSPISCRPSRHKKVDSMCFFLMNFKVIATATVKLACLSVVYSSVLQLLFKFCQDSRFL